MTGLRARPGTHATFEGRVFGGYRIARPIATGGMATVFLGRKTGPGRYAQTAAVKIIHPHLAQNRELVQMFLDEARLASCVNHPNVCRVLDFGEAEGTFFLAMEYVRGESWATVLKALEEHKEGRARVSPLAAHVVAQACEGLQAIHEAVDVDGKALNIVHRDVSPQNLIIAYDGSVRLLDFGIASAEGRAHTSSTEVIRGRYAYMAPEQMRGLDVDKRADIWSLGVMLREAITGKNLFARDTQIATMLAVTQEPLPAWPGRVPLRLREIVDLALMHNPRERFSDARELGNAINRYLNAQAEPALGAELSHYMRKLFAVEISQKRQLLRELAGDDSNTDTFSSVFPAPGSGLISAPPRTPDSAEIATAPRAQRSIRPGSLSFLIGAGVVFAGAMAASWYFVPRSNSEQVRLQPVLPAASEPAAVGASATAPTAATSAPDTTGALVAPPAAPAAPTADKPAAATEDKPTRETSASRHHHRSRRGRDEGDTSTSSSSEPAAKSEAPGTVVIGTSQGWAEVFSRGQKLGTTPLRIELPSGSQVLEVRPYGAGSSRRVPVDVKAGDVTKVRVDL